MKNITKIKLSFASLVFALPLACLAAYRAANRRHDVQSHGDQLTPDYANQFQRYQRRKTGNVASNNMSAEAIIWAEVHHP